MDTLTCHGESQDVQGRNPGKLAVIAPMLERIKLEEIINQHIPADEQAEFDHANHQFQGPLAIRPLFLHSPKRVESLVFLLMIGLTTYFLLQRTFRQNTPEDAPRVEQKTTSEKILRTFENYTILVYDHSPFLREVCATHLTQRQLFILNRLNFPTPSQTLRQRLPPRPDG